MNTTIKAKLIWSISVILLLLFSTLLFVLSKLSDFNQRVSDIVDQASERITLSNDIMYNVMDITVREKNIILEQDSARMLDYETEISQLFVMVDIHLVELEIVSSESGKIVINNFRKAFAEYDDILKEILALKKKKNEEAAFGLSTGKAKTLRYKIINHLNKIIDNNKERMEMEKIKSNDNYEGVLTFISALIGIVLLLVFGLSYWIVQTVSNRIRIIDIGAKKIASRDLSEIDFNDNVRDELKPVTDSLKDIWESFKEVTDSAKEIAQGNYDVNINLRSENDLLGISLNKMATSLSLTTADNKRQNWMSTGRNLLNEKISGEQNVSEIAENIIHFLCDYLSADIGGLYLNQGNHKLKLSGRYAFSQQEAIKETYDLGEGVIGQAAVTHNLTYITEVEEGMLRIASSILNARPKNIVVVPFLFDGIVVGVIELGKLKSFSDKDIEFLKSSLDTIGISVNSALSRKRIQNLLEETQTQSEELQVQQEELRQVNEELEEQTTNLKYQQEELQVANEELEEQAQRVELKNKQLEVAKEEIEMKTTEVEMSSRYKSQFLANMSHELRTPLNSLLILSKDLADNKKKNLDDSQIESAQIVYKSGKDLLQLINEVLDLSKIEAGKMDLNVEEIGVSSLIQNINRNFNHLAHNKGLHLSVVTVGESIAEYIYTDPYRLDQIIKNLISNAVKFTEKGGVTVEIQMASEDSITFSVKDTGIGIPVEKHAMIFEAFNQADGGTSRKFGGTGLGLSISKQLANLLGGEIKLESQENRGSCFILTIPVNLDKSKVMHSPRLAERRPAQIIQKDMAFVDYKSLPDDREDIKENDKSLLIIEDDIRFAQILKDQAKEKGFKVLIASTGEDGLLLAEKFIPKAIILDILLPGIQGRAVLNELKGSTALRHIPVHIISSTERTLELIREGAFEYITKPVDKDQLERAFIRIENFIDRKMKSLLIIEDNKALRTSIKVLIGNSDVKFLEAGTGKEALELIKNNNIDCIVLDLGLPDISGFDLIKQIQKFKNKNIPPIIIYTGKELTKAENDELQNIAETIIVKGVKSEERLLDETALFLHRTVGDLPEEKKDILVELYNKEAIFHNKKILIADDDMRNTFALSKVLKEQGMEIIKAENGLKAIKALNNHQDISLVLMDIMMPVMDGMEAIKKIRGNEKFQNLPIIAVTAKAMKEDRIKCIEAGANDYISKPIEVERLLSLMRIWIAK